VLYSDNTGRRFVAICDAGQNKIAVVDTDWIGLTSSRLQIRDSANNDITTGKGQYLATGIIRPHYEGCIVPIKVPTDGRLRVILNGANSLNQEETTLLDVEVDWIVSPFPK